MFSNAEMLAVVYLIIYIGRGDDQSEVVSKLRELAVKPTQEIRSDVSNIGSIYYDIEMVIEYLVSKITPNQIAQLLEDVKHVKKQDAFSTIKSMSEEKRELITEILPLMDIDNIEESYFDNACRTLNFPLSFRFDIAEENEATSVMGRISLDKPVPKTQTYQDSLLSQGPAFIANDVGVELFDRLVRIHVLDYGDSPQKIREELRDANEKQEPYPWSLAKRILMIREFITESDTNIRDDGERWFDNNFGRLINVEKLKHSKSPRSKGCLVPLIICLTGLTLSCLNIIGFYLVLSQ